MQVKCQEFLTWDHSPPVQKTPYTQETRLGMKKKGQKTYKLKKNRLSASTRKPLCWLKAPYFLNFQVFNHTAAVSKPFSCICFTYLWIYFIISPYQVFPFIFMKSKKGNSYLKNTVKSLLSTGYSSCHPTDYDQNYCEREYQNSWHHLHSS